MTAPFGVITSPNYPEMYDSHDDCGWLIEVDANHVVQLQYEDFDVEPHSNCSFDYVKLYDGANTSAPLIATHCGAGIPPPNMFRCARNYSFDLTAAMGNVLVFQIYWQLHVCAYEGGWVCAGQGLQG